MIDWTKPVETVETPPRPVRVLASDFKSNGFPYMCAVDYGDHEAHALFSAEGWDTQRVMRLRNVAPKPVVHEAWIALWGDGECSPAYVSYDACLRAHANTDRPEIRRIVWSSDGSPVDQEHHDSLEWDELLAERDQWKAKAEEMTAVVTAAQVWERHFSASASDRLVAAVRKYRERKETTNE
jgi:hypothetical protein